MTYKELNKRRQMMKNSEIRYEAVIDGIDGISKDIDSQVIEKLINSYIEEAMKSLQDDISETSQYIEEAIKELEPKKKSLIRLRYLSCYSWIDIARKIRCTLQETHNLHGHVLKELNISGI